MWSRLKQTAALLIALLLVGCINSDLEFDHPLYIASNDAFPTKEYQSFTEYQADTTLWLKRNRVYLQGDKESELLKNAPFELKPAGVESPTKGIILVHGLGDSPWSFVDIAQKFADKGYLVRSLLLSGHGSRPADLLSVDVSDWEMTVQNQIEIMKKEVNHLSLGGFSTGANLVTTYANDDEEIEALYLFSPAFKSDTALDFLAPTSASITDWIYQGDPEKHANIVRYNTVPLNGFAQYYWSSYDVRNSLNNKSFDRPAFLAVTQDDSVVDVQRVLSLFEKKFTNVNSKFIWFGDEISSKDSRVVKLKSRLPAYNISNFSHMSLLFKKDNPYYGSEGSYRMCHNGSDENPYDECIASKDIWYSAWGYYEEGKVHARLTFNPHFEQMFEYAETIMDPQS